MSLDLRESATPTVDPESGIRRRFSSVRFS